MTATGTARTRWLGELEQLGATIRPLDADLHRRVHALTDLLRRQEVTVSFGGHFSSGKSTILNVAIGRPLLPVDDYPETGAICVLRSGPRDAVEVVAAGRRKSIPCTTEAIRREVALVSETGEDRAHDVRKLERVELTLGGAALPDGLCLIDSPGINDTGTMNDRALQAAELADVLVWVLSSRQLLSEVEVEFLAGHVRRHGPASVLFVLNVFLDTDTVPAWNRTVHRMLPYCRNKLRDQGPAMGLGGGQARLLVVSGRAASNGPAGRFGGDELRRAVHGLAADRLDGEVAALRAHRALLELKALVAPIRRHANQERKRLDAERQARLDERAALARRRGRVERAIRSDVDGFLDAWAEAATARGARMAASVSVSSLARDGSYGRELTAALRSDARAGVERLVRAVGRHADGRSRDPLGSAGRARLGRILTPEEVKVVVPDSPIGAQRSVTGAVIGGVLGFLGGGPPGAIAGGALGGAVGAAGSTKKALDADVMLTRSNIVSGVEQAVASMRRRRGQAVSYLTERCATMPPPDTTGPVPRWEPTLTTVRRLTDQLSRLDGAGRS